MSRYRFIEAHRKHYPVRLLCQVLGVVACSYYTWQQAHQQAVTNGVPAWEMALVKVFGWHKRRYGTRRPTWWPCATRATTWAASADGYFEYYNYERLHSSIDYQPPCHAHQQPIPLNALNCPA
ncbi:hypothetical protein [Hymenobacter sp. YC55]|uniref:hypothetical protein n=1 Tax=Hymenobacter sp. YC55 TaxID=3034019 RepID=UPI0023F99486|nr:hypothetical protein [Hymenobacter sp. YC55]MDF7813906.1 hypothetical protein [Hymenobacter sp. YC55]